MIEIKGKSLFLREGTLLLFLQGLQQQDLLRKKPSSLLILWGWSLISIASLMMHSMCPIFMANDPGVLKLDTVTQVYAVLGHG